MEQEFICEFCRQRTVDWYTTDLTGVAACGRCGCYIANLDRSTPKLASHLRARAICNTMARHGWRQV